MKNRRNVVIVFLLLAVLCLGIGFAALTDDLFVNSTLSFKDTTTNFDAEEIFFENAGVDATSTSAYVDTTKIATAIVNQDNGDENDVLNITVSEGAFNTINQKAVITVDIRNNSSYSVDVAVDEISQSVGSTFTIDIALGSTSIAANNTTTVTITIELVGTTEVTEQAVQFKLTATATALTE